MVYAIVSDGSELSLIWRNPKHRSRAALKNHLRENLEVLCSKGDSVFYVNCEYGVPLWAAEIICELKKTYNVELNIVMPYEEQAATWSSSQRTRYYKVHEQADNVHLAITKYRNNCYNEADDFMLFKSDSLIVYASDPNDLYAVKHAYKHNVNISLC